MSPDEPTMAELGWRINELDRRMTGELSRLTAVIAGIAYVSRDVYAVEQRTMNDKLDSAIALSKWAIGLVSSTTIGAIIVAILGLSGVFR